MTAPDGIPSPRSPRGVSSGDSSPLRVVKPIPLSPKTSPRDVSSEESEDTEAAGAATVVVPVRASPPRAPKTTVEPVRSQQLKNSGKTASHEATEVNMALANLQVELEAMRKRVKFLEYAFAVFAILLVVGLVV